jgi:hypothetical protein
VTVDRTGLELRWAERCTMRTAHSRLWQTTVRPFDQFATGSGGALTALRLDSQAATAKKTTGNM